MRMLQQPNSTASISTNTASTATVQTGEDKQALLTVVAFSQNEFHAAKLREHWKSRSSSSGNFARAQEMLKAGSGPEAALKPKSNTWTLS